MYYDHYGEGIVNSFTDTGSFGLSTGLTNPAGLYDSETSPRFTGINNLPDINVGTPPPNPQNFPYSVPDGSFLITWGLSNKIKTPYSEISHSGCGTRGRGGWRRPGRRGLAYRTFANSVANALRGDCSRFRPPRFLRSGRCSVRIALGAAACCMRRRCSTRSILALRRLRGIRPQQPVFQGCAVKTADDGLHLVARGRFDKCEALGFLRFVVSDHFNGVGDQIFGG